MIEGKKIVLVPFEKANATEIRAWMADPYYKFFFKNMPEMLNEDQLKEFPRIMGMNVLMIYDRGQWYSANNGVTHFNPAALGMCSWDNVRYLARTCEMGIIIDKNFSGQHYGKESIFLFLDYLFNRMGFHKVSAHTADEAKETNEKCLDAVGFKLEGTIRDNFYLDGEWKDEKRWSLLQDEFNELYSQLLMKEEFKK